jgi:hypothetical protein
MRGLNLTGRGSLSAMFACALAIALGAGGGTAFAGTNCGPPASLAGSCFAAGDGNQLDGPGDLVDWQSTPVTAIGDGPKGNDTKFAGGDKELEPGSWDFITGNNTPKDDLLEGWTNFSSSFLYASFVRFKQEGDTFLAFELNQLGAGPRTSGGIPVPHRSTGDVLITYDISTTNETALIGMCTWSGDENSGHWLKLDGTAVTSSHKKCTHLDPDTSPAAMGTMNWHQSITNFLPDYGSPIGAGQFGEAAVNLGALAGNFLTDPCGPNGWFWMHSRASDSVLSQPKDLLAGAPITSPTCDLAIDKKVSLSGAPGTFVDADADNPLAAEVGDTVTYQITVTNTGTANLSVNVTDPRCDGPLSGPNGLDGVDDPLAAGDSISYTCTHLILATDDDPLTNTACTTGTATLGSASTTIGDDPKICDSTVVDVFQPGQLSKGTGTKFQDVDGNGVHDGGEGPLGGFVFFVDYNDNGVLDAGEPAAVSTAGGTWQIAGIKPGTWKVREASDPKFTCTLPSPCERVVTFTAGQTSDAGDWGNHSNGQAVSPSTTPGGQAVLGERITPGRARLIGPAGCVSRAFHARVAGKKIARVIFILDGKKVLTLKRTNFHKTFAIRLDPRRLSIGVHRLVAKVTFQRGSGTKAKTFRLSFQRCPRALRAPRFTG